ncbi:MAG TPA: hypothetical protein VLF66_00175, partial [Thermoanaerobaculia bacterium]|nr:hypothetical protein [Thermoanaerobaculia bacterium]
GLYLDDEGRLNVFLKDTRMGEAFRSIDPDVRVHQADYDFARLHAWRLESRAGVLGQTGVVFVDVDETQNRLRIGVERSAERATLIGLAKALRDAGVPREAVVIERTDPIHFVATLRDKIRPVPGGMQIRFSNFLCTLGFNAFRSGVSGFVTNSHCTDRQGSNSGTQYFQPLDQVADQFIGTEQVDPSYFRNQQGCPRGAKCRFSDSSWASYDSASLSAGDEIARPDGTNNGSITIDPNNPRFFITAKDTGGNQLVGTTVNKVGRTTGWTRGQVSGSCVDTGVSGSNIVLLCQDFVDAGVGGGDSGSNVFVQTGTDSATLVGILWGGNSAGTLFVYSPYSAVKSELALD